MLGLRNRLTLPAATVGTGASAGAFLAVAGSQASPMMAALALVGMLIAGFVFASPILGFLLTAFVVPLERIGRLTNDSAATTVSLMRIVGTLSLVALLFQRLVRRKDLWLPTPVWLYSGYFVFLLMSVVKQPSLREGIRGTTSMLANVMFIVLTVNAVRNRRHVKLAIAAWLASTALIGVFTIYQYHMDAAVTEDQRAATGMRTTEERFSTVLHDSAEYEVLGNSIKRAIGSTSNAAVYGINLILTLPFLFWALHEAKSTLAAIGILTIAAVVMYNTLLTNTRAVVATMAVCVILSLLFGVLRIKPKVWFGLGCAALAVIPFIPSEIYERALAPSNYTVEKSASLRYRFLYWETAVGIISENFWFGVGAGNQTIIPETIKNVHMPPNASAHNEYLNSLMEVGIFGYLMLAAFLVSAWRRFRSGAKRFARLGDNEGVLLMRAIMVNFLCVLCFAVQVDVLHFPLKGWWLALGLGVALERMSRLEWTAAAQGRVE